MPRERNFTDDRADDDRDDSDIDDMIRRRRRKLRNDRSNRIGGLLVAGAVLFLVACVVGGCVTARLKNANSPQSSKPVGQGSGGVDTGLFAPVDSGVRAVLVPTAAKEGETWTPRELFEFLKGKGVVSEMDSFASGGPFAPSGFFKSPKSKLDVFVQKRNSASSAKDEASLSERKAYSWGRYLFISEDDQFIARIAAVLPSD